MGPSAPRADRRAAAVIVVALAALAVTVGRPLWAGPGSPWWAPFALWSVLLLVGVALAWRDDAEAERRA